jgi:uncharacterized protein YycO
MRLQVISIYPSYKFMSSVAGNVQKNIVRRLRRMELKLWLALLRLLKTRVPLTKARLSPEEQTQVRTILQPGDILLEDDSAYPLWQVASRVVGSRWSHMAFYIGDGLVIDAGTKPYVAEIDLEEFLQTSNIAVFRPKYKHPSNLWSAVNFMRNRLGCPFNSSFNLNKQNTYYCAQLISRAFAQMPVPIHLQRSQWLGKQFILPSAVEYSEDFTLVWSI